MRNFPVLPLLTVALAAPLLVLAAAPAQAQGIIRPAEQARTPSRAAPALPGLAARQTPAPIPGDPTRNLSPNAALFDAIARGDLAAARDAVARGANIEARNALGLSPLDAAVDQGRNEIAFYLLSARGRAGTAPAAAAPSAAARPAAAIAAPPASGGPGG
ncbi:ankyrin repeat domain-containing protein, partial [Falsiroseomonas selenitidurans]